MTGATRQNRALELASQAEAALARGAHFEAERVAHKSLLLARQAVDFERMAAIVPTLMEARATRLRKALKTGRITIVDEPVTEETRVREGCYLVQPPLVGADARRLRLAALEREVAVAVLCREPLTQVRLTPVVAISPGATVRTKVPPPRDADKPEFAWFTAALDALGTAAVDTLDAAIVPFRRVDALLERLDAVTEHEGLHHALQQACMEAHQAEQEGRGVRALRKARACDEAGDGVEAPVEGDAGDPQD